MMLLGLVGDLDCDQDFDLTDFTDWDYCMTGPGGESPTVDCTTFDFDTDASIDLHDFANFQQAFGPP